MIRKRFKKSKKIKDLIPDSVAEKAASLNPLTEKAEEPKVLQAVPQITTETIAEHREEVLSGARKFIYPLQHSKHRIVVITVSLVVAASIGLLIYCLLGMYKLYQHNAFLYRVTQVVPFPIAKAGDDFVAYENYLFELRRYAHYHETQRQGEFGGEKQLDAFRQQALDYTIRNAYVKDLARENGVKVTNKEVDIRITEVRNQNRLGGNNKVFADVLQNYWGWSVNDFKRSLKQEILAQKVAAKLDVETSQRAQDALAQVRAGADFPELAKKVSDDKSAKDNGGDFGFAITKTNPNVPPEVVAAIFKLKSGQTSDIILSSPVLAGTAPTLQIIKVIENNDSTATAQHIVFNLKDINIFIEERKKAKPVQKYVKFD